MRDAADAVPESTPTNIAATARMRTTLTTSPSSETSSDRRVRAEAAALYWQARGGRRCRRQRSDRRAGRDGVSRGVDARLGCVVGVLLAPESISPKTLSAVYAPTVARPVISGRTIGGIARHAASRASTVRPLAAISRAVGRLQRHPSANRRQPPARRS